MLTKKRLFFVLFCFFIVGFLGFVSAGSVNVTLLTPSNGTSQTINSFDLSFGVNVSSNCSAYLWYGNGTFIENDTGTSVSDTGTYSLSNLANNSYLWNAKCTNDSWSTSYWADANYSFTIYNGSISECGTISGSGNYSLISDINSSGTCMTIDADDVVLDCQGYSINFSENTSNKYGVTADDNSNITIKNCVINQANTSIQTYYGVRFSNIDNSTIYNNTITLNNLTSGGAGIFLRANSTNVNISHNFIVTRCDASGFGIYLRSDSNETIIYNNDLDVYSVIASFGILLGGTDNNVSNCNISKNNVMSSPGTNGSSALFLAGIDNLIYDNILNSSSLDYHVSGDFVTDKPFYSYYNWSNKLNTTKTAGTNIMGRSYIGGNYWTNPTGTGYSDTCADSDGDYICDVSYTLGDSNIDYLPLAASTGTSNTNNNNNNDDSSGGSPTTAYWKGGTYWVLDSDFEKGYSKQLKEKARLRIRINDEDHFVGIVDLKENSALINVSSKPQQKELKVGEEWKVDINSDDIYDLLVSLLSIEEGYANVSIKSISENVLISSNDKLDGGDLESVNNSGNEGLDGGDGLIWVVVVIVLILAIGGFVYFRKRK